MILAMSVPMWLIVVVVSAAAGFLLLTIIAHNLRIWRVRRVFRSLPEEVRQQALELIQRAAARGPSFTFLRLAPERACDGTTYLTQSHVGGAAYAETGDEWPTNAERLLMQVRIDEPSLGEAWQGRLIAVFLTDEYEQVVRSYANPSPDRAVPLRAPKQSPCVPLIPLRMPLPPEPEGDRDDGLGSPAWLCSHVLGLRELLSPLTRDVSGLLTQILHPRAYGYSLEESDLVYVGGRGLYIQQPHEPECSQCGKRMRFLLQFGDVVPEVQLADAGVCYVYGCNDHPDCCQAFVDSH